MARKEATWGDIGIFFLVVGWPTFCLWLVIAHIPPGHKIALFFTILFGTPFALGLLGWLLTYNSAPSQHAREVERRKADAVYAERQKAIDAATTLRATEYRQQAKIRAEQQQAALDKARAERQARQEERIAGRAEREAEAARQQRLHKRREQDKIRREKNKIRKLADEYHLPFPEIDD